ncbi:hypothetical protein Btru_000356 [Bulinus truncatus]|nr:hypothetical protein Btru_000356 [Bulinus truncatus]
MSYVNSMQNWLRNSYGINVSLEWLTACLEWIEQENKTNIKTERDLQCQVFEQWLMSDLSEIGEKLLPTDLSLLDSKELKKNYPLQLISHIDIGRSLYSQLQNIDSQTADCDETNDNNKPWMIKPSRMLLLHLTDGHMQVKAMEYKPIELLNGPLPYGSKILLRGPLKCRNGIILLTSENVQVLGGEVETTEVDNKPEEVLRKAMMKNRENAELCDRTEFSGAFLSRNKINHKSDQATKNKNIMANYTNPQTRGKKQSIHSNCLDTLLLKVENVSQQSNPGRDATELSKNIWPFKGPQVNDDEWQDDIDYFHLFEDEMNFKDNEEMNAETDLFYKTKLSSKQSHLVNEARAGTLSSDTFQIKEEGSKSMDQSDSPELSTQIESKLNSHLKQKIGKSPLITAAGDSLIKSQNSVQSSSAQIKKRKTVITQSGYIATASGTHFLNSLSAQPSKANSKLSLAAVNHDLHLRAVTPNRYLPQAVIQPIDHTFQHLEDCITGTHSSVELPYQYLSDISKLITPAVLTIKAFISTLTEKLGSGNGNRWTLACRINDGTATMDVDMDDAVLTKLIGFSAQTSVQMRQQIKTQPHIKQVLMQGLSQCQQKLINMSCLMELEITSHKQKPVVKKLIEPSVSHIYNLLNRLETHLPS